MRKIALCLLLPTLLAVGSILIPADRAEARIRHRVVVVPRAARVVRPRVYVAPRVHVHTPRVHVDVGPRPYIYRGYHGYRGGSVYAPGVHVHW